MNTFIECTFIEIPQEGIANILIGSVYRPQNTNLAAFNDELIILPKIIDGDKDKLVFLAGHFNMDLIKHDTNLTTDEFLNNLLSYSFMLAIQYPTRPAGASVSLIDNIL